MWKKSWKQNGMPPKNGKNGFTLLESLTALMCALIVFSLCLGVMQVLSASMQSFSAEIRQMGILQLREYCASFDTFTVKEGILEMENARDSCTMEFHKGRIVRRPGYEIFLEGLDDGTFLEEDGIWLEVERNGQTSSWQIVAE